MKKDDLHAISDQHLTLNGEFLDAYAAEMEANALANPHLYKVKKFTTWHELSMRMSIAILNGQGIISTQAKLAAVKCGYTNNKPGVINAIHGIKK